jgi:hypothetical protein
LFFSFFFFFFFPSFVLRSINPLPSLVSLLASSLLLRQEFAQAQMKCDGGGHHHLLLLALAYCWFDLI